MDWAVPVADEPQYFAWMYPVALPDPGKKKGKAGSVENVLISCDSGGGCYFR
jgi:hypothetical protein